MAESQVNFSNRTLLNTRVRLPPLPEQRRIAEILDTVDEAIRKTEEVIAKLEQMKQGLLHDLLTRGIDENGELRDPERHPEQFKDSPLGGIPREWDTEQLERLTTKIVDGVHKTPVYTDRGIPFITVENLTRGAGISFSPSRFVSRRDHREYWRRAPVAPGDVLVSKDGTLGVARTVPGDAPEFSIFVSVALLKPRTEVISSDFLRLFFESGQFFRQLRHLSAGSGLQHIHLSHFRQFQLPLPSLMEQQRILTRVQVSEQTIAAERQDLEKLQTLKRGLMDDLLTGRVCVNVDEEAT